MGTIPGTTVHSHEIRRWGSVALELLVVVENGEASAGGIFTFGDGEVWPADIIFRHWVARMSTRYVRAAEAGRASAAGADRLKAWIQETRAAAADVRIVHGDRLAGLMCNAADELLAALDW